MAADDEERRVACGLDQEALQQRVSALAQEGFSQAAVHVMNAAGDERLYSGIWSNLSPHPTTVVPVYGGWEQAGQPQEQWCYEPSQPFADGMQLYPDYLHRTGYRLPTEAEWEYACRAGATTSRPYGETMELLSRYAWYSDNSQQRHLLRVGSLKPNDFGLFDMLGNSIEWCQERIRLYPTDRPLVEDVEQPEEVQNGHGRVLRGGSFYSPAAHVRRAYRSNFQPFYRGVVLGFRLARTCP